MTTITLPIKCSTVKRLEPILEIVVISELAILFVLMAIQEIMEYLETGDISMFLITVGFAVITSIAMMVMFTLVAVYRYIEEHFPKFECINDNEDKPQ